MNRAFRRGLLKSQTTETMPEFGRALTPSPVTVLLASVLSAALCIGLALTLSVVPVGPTIHLCSGAAIQCAYGLDISPPNVLGSSAHLFPLCSLSTAR